MWKRYFSNDELIMLSEELMLPVFGKPGVIDSTREKISEYYDNEVERLIQYQVQQSFFKSAVLSNFNEKCCLTGITQSELLIACHIIPWEQDKSNRLNPKNGLCFNALHATAFNKGLITLDNSLKVIISSKIPRNHVHALILDFEDQQIEMPQKYMPSQEFLDYHRNKIFVA